MNMLVSGNVFDIAYELPTCSRLTIDLILRE